RPGHRLTHTRATTSPQARCRGASRLRQNAGRQLAGFARRAGTDRERSNMPRGHLARPDGADTGGTSLACWTSMRIAQVAPLHESVPPRLYGGTERVVHYLTEELVTLGHEVTLYASGDSRTSAELVSVCPRSLRFDEGCVDPLAHHMRQLEL